MSELEQPRIPASHEVFYSIWDVDNCIANDMWRAHMIDYSLPRETRYDKYNSFMGSDQPAHLAQWSIITAMSQPIFFTGCEERWRKLRTRWIKEHLLVLRDGKEVPLLSPIIYMRDNYCMKSPAEVKEEMLHKFFDHVRQPQIISAVDDVPAIITMYRKYGLPATQLAVHDPVHMYEKHHL